ncbi:MAG: hypothetical protein CMJ58_11155 [Planctomycetaceae bacterium]|nr:hypothetical protein [Planctomycetaceae bacterium]
MVTEATSGADHDRSAYVVARPVSSFDADDDFSTPEAAYATINRCLAEGRGDWLAMSASSLRDRLSQSPTRLQKPTQEEARQFLAADILSVRVDGGDFAQVIARWPSGSKRIDVRTFELENGRWLNAGNSRYASVEAAESAFRRVLHRRNDLETIRSRPPIDDPDALLADCVAYLREHGQPPLQFVLDALGSHRLVAIGEVHHRPTYWQLNSAIVRDPRFAEVAGTIYLELPMHAQPLVDQFLAAEELNTALVIETLRDNLWTGWPDAAMLDFFVSVWETNRQLDPQRRIRIVLVDMQRPWRELIREQRLHKYDGDRNQLMADNIRRDMATSADPRHALFIVGYAHLESVRHAGAEKPRRTAGVILREWLHDNLLTIVQHGPMIANMGRVFGRAAEGLFDEAFAEQGHAPVAFSLRGSQFGTHRFDLNGDERDSAMSNFEEAFDAYLYLGPLEDERFSPLISGFYTDDFAQELDQRYRLLTGKGLVEGLRLPAADGQSLAQWMGHSWGQPRTWNSRLGPKTRWRMDDGAGEYLVWNDPPAMPTIDADPTTRNGMIRLVEDFLQHNFRDIQNRRTVEWGGAAVDSAGNRSIDYRFESASAGGARTAVFRFTFAPNGGLISVIEMQEQPAAIPP